LVLLDSKRGDLFVQEFTADRKAAGAPAILSPDSVRQRLASGAFTLAGDGIPIVRADLDVSGLAVSYSSADGPVDAADVVRLAVRSVTERTGLPPVPLYLRAPEVRPPSAPACAPGSAASSH